MKETVVPSQYLQIALDIAQRIAKGELPEGSRIYGRSLMASEYNVSPETVRRAPSAAGGYEGGGGQASERRCGSLCRQRPAVH